MRLLVYQNREWGEGEEADQDKYWGGVCREGEGQIYGGENKGGKNQDKEERGGGMCPGYGKEEEVSVLI